MSARKQLDAGRGVERPSAHGAEREFGIVVVVGSRMVSLDVGGRAVMVVVVVVVMVGVHFLLFSFLPREEKEGGIEELGKFLLGIKNLSGSNCSITKFPNSSI